MQQSNEQLVTLFLEYLRVERQYSADTVKAYHADLNQLVAFLAHEDTKKTFKTMDQLDVRVLLANLYELGNSTRTIARKVSSLRAFFAFLVRNGIVDVNPFADVQLKKDGRTLPRHFYEKELTKIFDQAAQDNTALGLRNQLILEILYGCGLRVAELAGLKISDFDRQSRTIMVHGKGDKMRLVPFGEYASDALTKYLADGRPKLVNGKKSQVVEQLLLNRRGEPITTAGIEYLLKKIAQEAGLTQNITAHMFRHTFASDLLNNGADLRTVQSLLGHSNLSTTQIYTNITTQDLQKNYRKFFPRA